MGLTTDPNDPELKIIGPDGQQKSYMVLSDEERAKGFVRPVREWYRHAVCGEKTRMGLAIAETYARDPNFYGGTFCCACGRHFPLIHQDPITKDVVRDFLWLDGSEVGT